MNPATLMRDATADGVYLRILGGTLKASGDRVAVNRWLPIIREHKPALLEHLRAAKEAALSAELGALIRKVAAFHGAVASRDVDNALVSFRLLAAEVDAFMGIDREAFEERAGILEYDGCYSRPEAELLAAWEATQALFARLTAREWLARHAPERLPEGESPDSYAISQVKPGNDFWLERERRGGRR